MKYILLIFLYSTVISCSGKSDRIQIVGKWINLNVCMPDDFLFFDFSNNRLTTLNNKVYDFRIYPTTIIIQLDSTVSVPYTDILVNGDTLKITLDDEHKLLLLKFNARSVTENFMNNQLYEHKFAPQYPRDKTYYMNFIDEEKVVVTEVDIAASDTISAVYRFHQYRFDNGSILNFSNMPCNTFLLKKGSNDTILATGVHRDKFHTSKIFPYRERLKVKAKVEALTGLWEVADCSSPDRKNFVSLTFSQNNLTVEGIRSGHFTSRYSLDLLGRIVVSNFELFEFNNIEINDIKKDKLIVTVSGVTYTLVRN